MATICVSEWAEKLNSMGRGKHFIGDFLPPDELEKFMETWNVSVCRRIVHVSAAP